MALTDMQIAELSDRVDVLGARIRNAENAIASIFDYLEKIQEWSEKLIAALAK